MPMDSYSTDDKALRDRQRPWGSIDRRALDAVEYWLEHKKGADFIVVDGFTASEDRGLVPDEFTALGKFSRGHHWLRSRADPAGLVGRVVRRAREHGLDRGAADSPSRPPR